MRTRLKPREARVALPRDDDRGLDLRPHHALPLRLRGLGILRRNGSDA